MNRRPEVIGMGKNVQKPCLGCVYFKECGETMRTAPCAGRKTKSELKKELIGTPCERCREAKKRRCGSCNGGFGVCREYMDYVDECRRAKK